MINKQKVFLKKETPPLEIMCILNRGIFWRLFCVPTARYGCCEKSHGIIHAFRQQPNQAEHGKSFHIYWIDRQVHCETASEAKKRGILCLEHTPFFYSPVCTVHVFISSSIPAMYPLPPNATYASYMSKISRCSRIVSDLVS